jgi:hypothetical protein
VQDYPLRVLHEFIEAAAFPVVGTILVNVGIRKQFRDQSNVQAGSPRLRGRHQSRHFMDARLLTAAPLVGFATEERMIWSGELAWTIRPSQFGAGKFQPRAVDALQ